MIPDTMTIRHIARLRAVEHGVRVVEDDGVMFTRSAFRDSYVLTLMQTTYGECEITDAALRRTIAGERGAVVGLIDGMIASTAAEMRANVAYDVMWSAFCQSWVMVAVCASPLADAMTVSQRGGL